MIAGATTEEPPVSARFGLRLAAMLVVGALYVLFCQWLMTRSGASPWNVVGVVAPMLAAAALGAWQRGRRGWAAVAGIGLLALCAQALFGLRVPTQWLYLAQHAGVNLCLAAGFASTLRAGRTPLITVMARRVHRVFTPAMALYTRKLTQAWTLYFVGIAALSVALYAFASFAHWAVFANFIAPASVALMFGVEYAMRYRLHPEFERTTIADAIRSYLHGTAE